MRCAKIIACAMLIGFLAACSNPHRDAAKAREQTHKVQEEVAGERLELVDRYQTCMKKTSANNEKIEASDSYFKDS